MGAWPVAATGQAPYFIGGLAGQESGLAGDPNLSDQPACARHPLLHQRLHHVWSSGWVQTPRSSSLVRSSSPRTALKAGVDVLPHSLFLFLHSVLPGSSSVSRCSHSSEKHFIPAHFGCSRPRSLPSSLRIPASEQRPFSSRRFL